MECEELGCVVGGPFKPNKLREVRGLVWRPWINKPSEMTMRCADICHHTAPASKHKPPKPSLPCPVSHMVPPPSHHPSLPLFILSLHPFYLHYYSFISNYFLTPSFFPLVSSATLLLLFLLPPPPISIPPFHVSPVTPSIHPFIHACMAGCPSGVLSVL